MTKTRILKSQTAVIFAILLAFWVTLPAGAVEITLDVTQRAAVVQSNRSQALVKFEIPTILRGARIDLALLEMRLFADTTEGTRVHFALHPAATTWLPSNQMVVDPNVAVVDTVGVGVVHDFRQSNKVIVNITEIVQGWVDGTFSNLGFRLHSSLSPRCLFSLARDASWPLNTFARVRIRFTPPER